MKTLTLFLAVTMAITMVKLASANDGDSTRVITKIVKITDNGKTIVDTTIIISDEDIHPFMENFGGLNTPMMKYRKFNAPKGKTMVWTNDEEQEYEVAIESDGDSSNVVVMRKPGKQFREFKFDGDPMKEHRMMMWHEGNIDDMPDFRRIKQQNMHSIDLNDPNIISFEREQTKDGNEKITIIRKKVKE